MSVRTALKSESAFDKMAAENERLHKSVALLNRRIAQLLEDDSKLFKALHEVRVIADTVIASQSNA